MREPRYVLLVRATGSIDTQDAGVPSAFADGPVSWAVVRAAWENASRSMGASWRVYTVVPVEVVAEPSWMERAGEAPSVPWAAPHVQESEALRSPPPCPLCEAGHKPMRPCP